MSGSRSDNTSFPLFGLDPNVRKQNVYPHVAIDVLGLFAQTCHQAEAETAFLRLLPAAIGAEPDLYVPKGTQPDETRLAAIAILKRHPDLLFRQANVIDHFGREIVASPYQLLLGAGDVWALKQVHEEIISKIADEKARAHMQEQAEYQFQQQFPNCKLPFDPELGEAALYDERNEAMIAQVIVQLETIAEAIAADPCTNGVATNDATIAAVAALREIFAPKQGEVIKTGLHFPLAIMQEIYKVYVAAQWNLPRLSYFSREVIGAALDASTAVDGQCYKVGLSNLNAEKGPDRRDGLFCRHPKGVPADKAPLRGKLGHTMFVDTDDGKTYFQSANSPGLFDWYNKNGDGGVWWARPAYAARPRPGRTLLGKLMSGKNFSLGELMRPHREEKTSRCVIL